MKIRFGVIGCSRVAQKGMLPALTDSEFAELKMVGSRNLERAKEVADKFHCEAWGTYDDVLKNPDIDAVYISLPHSLHEEWSVKAANAKKNILCEKPAAISYAAGLRMVEAARHNKVRLLEGLMFRYHPQHAKVHALLKDGTLGELIRFEGCFGYPLPERSSTVMQRELAGGSLFACAPYPVYASRMMFGSEPESVLCHLAIDKESGVDMRADMMLRYKDQRFAFASSIFGSYFQSTYSMLGGRAHVKVARAYAVPRDIGTKILVDANDKVEEIAIDPADHFRIMVDDFCSEIMKGESSVKDYENDLLSQSKVLEAAKVSDRENRVVELREIEENRGVLIRRKVSLPGVKSDTNRRDQVTLLTGGSGKLGSTIVASGCFNNLLSPSHSELDITKPEIIREYLKRHRPSVIIHCAALVKMVEWSKEATKERGIDVNIIGTSNLVKEVLREKEQEGRDIRFIYVSTDGVYEGTRGSYRENDPTIPYHPYGWTKLGGECTVNVLPNYCVIRTSFFDPQNIPFETSATDMYASKMPIDELPPAIALLIDSDFVGTVNVGDERKSYYDRYKKFKPSLGPTTFDDIAKDMQFRMAKDASLDITLWKYIVEANKPDHELRT